MTVIELINAVQAEGIVLVAEPPDLVIRPAGKIPRELKERLREKKAEVIQQLLTESEKNVLQQSLKRLESANILLAISEDGDLRIVESEASADQAVIDGYATAYSPRDAYMYITLSPAERLLLHSFKRQFGGTVEWKERDGF